MDSFKQELVANIVPLVVSALLTVIAYLVKKFLTYIQERGEFNEAEKEAVQCLLDGMSVAQEQIVRQAKAAAADGKLTDEEIKEAQSLAIGYAKNAATGKAKEILVSWTDRRLKSLIMQLLSKTKGVKNGNTTTSTGSNS